MNLISVSVPAGQYTSEKGAFVAEKFADNVPLWRLAEDYPDFLPSMMYMRRWRREYPAFDAMMIEAASARAERMAEDMLDIADDEDKQAAHTRNRLTTRKDFIGYLDPTVYGQKKAGNEDTTHTPVFMLSDEQLMRIASQEFKEGAIDGEAVRVESDPPYPPLEADERGAECEGTDTSKPAALPLSHSVTTPESEDQDPIISDGKETSFIGL